MVVLWFLVQIWNHMVPCLKCFGTKRAHSRVPGLKLESPFSVIFFVLSANRNTNLYIRISIKKWIYIQFQLCAFNFYTSLYTNSYVIQIWIRFYTNSFVQICINTNSCIRIHVNLQLADKTRKTYRSEKKEPPFVPRYMGMCTFSTKKLRPGLAWFCVCTRNHRTTIQKMRLIQIQFHAI